jgi:hypothetical protein
MPFRHLGPNQRSLSRLLACLVPLCFGVSLGLAAPIPSPGVFLGFERGVRYARSHEIVEYFRYVDSASDRVSVQEHGRSWEGRPLIHAVISSPQNLARLGEIRAANRRLTFDPQAVAPDRLKQMPLVIWVGAGVHGNEPSTSEASIEFLHWLATEKGWVEDLLKSAVIVLDPNLNPDGRERHTSWQNSLRSLNPSADVQDQEKTSPWSGGRTNHYWFDLNRDWLPLSQKESQARHAVYVQWRPQVTLDYHEMGSGLTYFFQPGVANRVHPLTPKSNQDWTLKIAAYNAKALEEVGQRYFTGERFDDFYPGKGSTYPDLTGSIGILFEQASSRGMRTQVGSQMSLYSTTVRNQLATMIASVRGSWENREGLLKHQREFFMAQPPSTAAAGGSVPKGGWTIRDNDYGRDLVRLLLRHEIRVLKDEKNFFVPRSQPLWRLVEAAFVPLKSFDDTSFYDISAWALPMASEAEITPLEETPAGREVTVSDLAPLPGTLVGAMKPLGWILRQGRADFHMAVARSLEAGHRTFFVRREVGGAKPGDVFVEAPVEDPKWLAGLRVEASGVSGQTGAVTSWGGSSLVEVRPPSIALAAGPTSDLNNTGEVWHWLDAKMGLTLSVVNPSAPGFDLSRYTTLILAGGSLPAAFAEPLTQWVRNGGNLIATSTSASWVSETALLKLETARKTTSTKGLSYAEASQAGAKHIIPGTAFRLDWDLTHPLSFGAAAPYSFRETQEFWIPPTEGGSVVAAYSAKPLAAGYASDEVLDLASGKAAVVARRVGSGRVILIADNPLFRGWFTQQRRLFLNAVFFSGAF